MKTTIKRRIFENQDKEERENDNIKPTNKTKQKLKGPQRLRGVQEIKFNKYVCLEFGKPDPWLSAYVIRIIFKENQTTVQNSQLVPSTKPPKKILETWHGAMVISVSKNTYGIIVL